MNDTREGQLARTLAQLEKNYYGGHISLEGYEHLKAEAIADSRKELRARSWGLARVKDRIARPLVLGGKRERRGIFTKTRTKAKPHILTDSEVAMLWKMRRDIETSLAGLLYSIPMRTK